MWNLEEIKKNKKFLNEIRFKSKISKEKMELTLLSYDLMLDNTGEKNKTLISNFINKYSNNILFNIKQNKYCDKYDINIHQEMNENYYYFLIHICLNILYSSSKNITNTNFNKIYKGHSEMIDLSKKFYEQLDDELYEIVCKIYEKKNKINFSKYRKLEHNRLSAVTYNDYYHNDSYINVYVSDSINDVISLNHEIMHAANLKINSSVFNENYFGFREIPTYTMDLLFNDYLIKNGYDKDSLLKIKQLTSLCCKILFSLCNYKKANNIEDLLNKINYNCIKKSKIKENINDLLEVESILIAYNLYDRISDNPKEIETLKTLMKTNINPYEIPDFSLYGLSNKELLNTSNKVKKIVEKRKLM